MESTGPIFEPLKFRNLTVKNRLTRSSITGRIDNYDGSGTQARINWESKFARGGVGMIMSAHIPIHIGGRIIPNVATIEKRRQDPVLAAGRSGGQPPRMRVCRAVVALRPPAGPRWPGERGHRPPARAWTGRRGAPR